MAGRHRGVPPGSRSRRHPISLDGNAVPRRPLVRCRRMPLAAEAEEAPGRRTRILDPVSPRAAAAVRLALPVLRYPLSLTHDIMISTAHHVSRVKIGGQPGGFRAIKRKQCLLGPIPHGRLAAGQEATTSGRNRRGNPTLRGPSGRRRKAPGTGVQSGTLTRAGAGRRPGSR